MKLSNVAVVVPALLVVLSAACTGAVIPVGTLDQPAAVGDAATSTGTSSSPAGDDASTPPSAAGPSNLPTCAEPSGESDSYASAEQLNTKMSGVWFLCSGSIWSPSDTAGIEITSGRAYHLVLSGGTLVRGSAPDYHRTVTTQEGGASGTYQVNLSSGSAGNGYNVRTSVDGRFLELSEFTSFKRARYVRAPHVAPACAATGPNQLLTSVEDTRARVAGKWRICSGAFMNSPAGTAGVELTADRAYFLQDSPTGLTRAVGWDHERDLAFSDDTQMNGPGYYGYSFSEGGRFNGGSVTIAQDGDKLVLADPMAGAPTVLARVH